MSNLISLIVPCYNEQEALPFFYTEVCKVADALKEQYNVDIEFLFVNDGSKDQTLELVKDLSNRDIRVKYTPSPEILARKVLFMPASRMLQAIIQL